MSGQWRGSNRGEELPAGWSKIRARILERDGYRCVWELPSGLRCPNVATDVDHIGSKWNHRDENLRALCGPHHDKRTAQQGIEARRPPPRRKRDERPDWA